MTDPAQPPRGNRRRQMLARLRGALDDPDIDHTVKHLGLRILARTERVVERMEDVTTTLESVVKLERGLLERMVPIVEDLGELVRHSLDDARERRGLPPRGAAANADTSDIDDDIIDVEFES